MFARDTPADKPGNQTGTISLDIRTKADPPAAPPSCYHVHLTDGKTFVVTADAYGLHEACVTFHRGGREIALVSLHALTSIQQID